LVITHKKIVPSIAKALLGLSELPSKPPSFFKMTEFLRLPILSEIIVK
jgi:hypothetical protein